MLLLPTIGVAQHRCKPIKVAIVDTGLDLTDPRFKAHLCKTGHRNFVEFETATDLMDHGTHVAGLIQKYAGNANYCLLIYKYYSEDALGTMNMKREVLAFNEAIKNGATVINYSGGGPVFSEEEAIIIEKHPEITFVVAAGNEGQNLDVSGNEYWPASLFYPNIQVVESVNRDEVLSKNSNYTSKKHYLEVGEDVESYLPNGKVGVMSGTSMSCAVHTGKLVDKLSNLCENR